MKSSTKVSTRGGQPGHWAGTNQTAHEDDNLELCVSLTETLPSFNLNQQHVPMEGFSHPCMPCYFHGFSCVFFDILGTEASTICLLTIYFTCVALTLKNIFKSERRNLFTICLLIIYFTLSCFITLKYLSNQKGGIFSLSPVPLVFSSIQLAHSSAFSGVKNFFQLPT